MKQLLNEQKTKSSLHRPALTVLGPIMLSVVRYHPPKAHSEPGKALEIPLKRGIDTNPVPDASALFCV